MTDDYEPALEEPLTDEELKTGDGYMPAVTSTDMRPKPRFGETWPKFAERMRTMVLDGDEVTRADAAEEERFNRYLAKRCRDAHGASTGDDVVVQLIAGEVYVCLPNGKFFRIEQPRWRAQISAGLQLAWDEIDRRDAK